ncbi:MAG: hypothetical protein KAX18_01350 [Candidatus Lokiarchaeota archaeon]|nr:hypothetical protein [Candidatus Lokiarchaeota archaeon]
MNSKTAIKYLLILGGIVEVLIGILFLFLDVFLEQLGIQNIPIFTQMAGTFIFGYGILLLYSSRNVEKFIIIPIINILIRITMIIFGIISLSEVPEFLVILIFAFSYDSIWSLLVLISIIKSGIVLKKS